MIAIFGSVMETIWKLKKIMIISFSFGVIAILSSLLWFIPSVPKETVNIAFIVCTFSYAAFILMAILAMVKSVFITDKVTADRIVGSLSIYLLIGMFFAFIYSGIGLIDHTAFNITDQLTHEMGDFGTYLYFSYSALTTTGFGDIVAEVPFVRMLTALEGIIGSFYLAVVVARFVGIHISQKTK